VASEWRYQPIGCCALTVPVIQSERWTRRQHAQAAQEPTHRRAAGWTLQAIDLVASNLLQGHMRLGAFHII
jgi:hypothetical protein